MIRLEGVWKAFGERTVLRDLSFSVDAGEFVLIAGASGAGKSTLLKLLYAAETPDRGDVVVAGKRVQLLRRSAIPYLRRNLGFVFQDFKLLERRTAFENVAITLEVRNLPRQEIETRTIEALESVGLEASVDQPVETLSGGEQQRVAIARAIIGEPAVLLADEPTGNLDPAQASVIYSLLARETDRGATVLLATHDPQVAHTAGATRSIELTRDGTVETTHTLGHDDDLDDLADLEEIACSVGH